MAAAAAGDLEAVLKNVDAGKEAELALLKGMAKFQVHPKWRQELQAKKVDLSVYMDLQYKWGHKGGSLGEDAEKSLLLKLIRAKVLLLAQCDSNFPKAHVEKFQKVLQELHRQRTNEEVRSDVRGIAKGLRAAADGLDRNMGVLEVNGEATVSHVCDAFSQGWRKLPSNPNLTLT